MMARARLITVLLLLLCSGCVTRAPLPGDADLHAVLEEAQKGRIDICRDARWATWRFDRGAEGRARFEQLKTLADKAGTSPNTDPNDLWSSVQRRGRASALSAILSGAPLARNRAEWRSAMVSAEARYRGWRERASRISSEGLTQLDAHRAIWARAIFRLDGDRRVNGKVAGDIESCLFNEPAREATYHFVQAIIAILDSGRWPSDAIEGRDASLMPLRLPSTTIGSAYLREQWQVLQRAGDEARMPLGGLALVRTDLPQDPAPPTSLGGFIRRFEREWPAAEELLNESQPVDIGAELTRRGRLEQYGRKMVTRVGDFGKDTDRGRADAFQQIWGKVERADKENTARVKILLQTRDWFDDDKDGEGAEFYGWLIVQHADLDPDFQRDVLKRLEPLLPLGRVRPSNYALLWDRVAVKDGRLQRYGTQVTCKDGRWQPQVGIEDPDRLDARRKEMGLGPWRDYAALFGPCR